MYVAKRGKPAPAQDRRILLAARAEAALVAPFISICALCVCVCVCVWSAGTRSLQNEIGIHDVIHALQKDTKKAESSHQPRCGWDDPVDVRLISGPAEPEQTG